MSLNILLYPIFVPLAASLLILCFPKKWSGALSLLAVAVTAALSVFLFKKDMVCFYPWVCGIDFLLRLTSGNSFILAALAFFSLLVSLYSLGFFKGGHKLFAVYLLISLSLANGAVLADHLVLLLFFWEGLLLTLLGFIALGGKNSFRTATKAFIIVGVSDLCMMAGLALTAYLAGTAVISRIHLPMDISGGIAFILLAIGAVSKAGSMPFHSWIPDAATDAPLPFMAFFPASLEKLLGIYMLGRISLSMFALDSGSVWSTVLMVTGALTILLAVLMALAQKNYKRLLSYHAISQVGYMVLGIGTCVPAGIIGGLFHMVNHSLYKCCLFLTGGAVEKEAGTTDLNKLGGLASRMPVTFITFIIAACSISGVPPFNGFFSKELVYEGALQRGMVFYLAAIAGSFLTAISFLKLGHAAFVDQSRREEKAVHEAPFWMLVPMIVLAGICVLFGLFHVSAVRHFIVPLLPQGIEEGVVNPLLPAVTVLVIVAAVLHHVWGARKRGSGLHAADDVLQAPVLSQMYRWQEKKYFDPYDVSRRVLGRVAVTFWQVDKLIDAVFSRWIPEAAFACSRWVRRAHAGYYVVYLIWALFGAFMVMMFVH